jgi:phosphopantetheinyl transferase
MASASAPSEDPWLLRVPAVGRGADARQAVRSAIVSVIAHWYGGDVVIRETSRGPQLGCGRFHLSISYDGTDGWVGVSAHRRVGVDAEAVRRIPEQGEIASQYLRGWGGAASDCPEVFTASWTALEAAHKAHGVSLEEEVLPDSVSCRHLRCGNVLIAVALVAATACPAVHAAVPPVDNV